MAHTDKTLPQRLWAAHGLTYHRDHRAWGFGRHESDLAEDVRRESRRQRRAARQALRRGVEPEPYRPRHNLHWQL